MTSTPEVPRPEMSEAELTAYQQGEEDAMRNAAESEDVVRWLKGWPQEWNEQCTRFTEKGDEERWIEIRMLMYELSGPCAVNVAGSLIGAGVLLMYLSHLYHEIKPIMMAKYPNASDEKIVTRVRAAEEKGSSREG